MVSFFVLLSLLSPLLPLQGYENYVAVAESRQEWFMEFRASGAQHQLSPNASAVFRFHKSELYVQAQISPYLGVTGAGCVFMDKTLCRMAATLGVASIEIYDCGRRYIIYLNKAQTLSLTIKAKKICRL